MLVGCYRSVAQFCRSILSPLWCTVVHVLGTHIMKPTGKGQHRESKEAEGASVRASISFSQDLYQTLEEIAKRKKVSLAWVVREASEQYVEAQWPLFAKK